MDESTLYIIRCSYEGDGGLTIYYQSPNDWTANPGMATLFRDYEIAETHMAVTHQLHDGDGSLYDIVPYWGEVAAVQNSLNNRLT